MINDDEIDLTEHRDFRERTISGFHMIHQNFENTSFWEELYKREQRRKFGGLPWNVYPENELYPYDGLVALGNAKQRKDGRVNFKLVKASQDVQNEYKNFDVSRDKGSQNPCRYFEAL